ncbi:endoglucanase 10, partial [Olea europaea subsp. europaea]
MKFGFPVAFTATVLSWTILEYGDQIKVVNQLEPAQDTLRWITDYLLNAHPSENVLYIQVRYGSECLTHSIIPQLSKSAYQPSVVNSDPGVCSTDIPPPSP